MTGEMEKPKLRKRIETDRDDVGGDGGGDGGLGVSLTGGRLRLCGQSNSTGERVYTACVRLSMCVCMRAYVLVEPTHKCRVALYTVHKHARPFERPTRSRLNAVGKAKKKS